MTIVGMKLSASFLDVLGKVDDDVVDKLKSFDFETIDVTAPFIIQLQQVQRDENNVGMAPNLTPLNIFSRDLKGEKITLKREDIIFFFDVDNTLENFFRESIGDVTISTQKVYVPN